MDLMPSPISFLVDRSRAVHVAIVVTGLILMALPARAMNKAELIESISSGSSAVEVELLLTGPGPPVAGFDVVISYSGSPTTIEHILLGRQVNTWSMTAQMPTPGVIQVSAAAPAGDSVVDELQGIVVLCDIDPGTVTFDITSIVHYDEAGAPIGGLTTFGTTFTVTSAVPLLGPIAALLLAGALGLSGARLRARHAGCRH
ncbi:MAG: hypothetical protein JRH17_17925 [Deltaproteobacteria bacterium]|nr:hypothetical protein [Deltaproteobacteria bacterium]MBW2697115.1 hypothetical protein [Deltaproteobacteria bacterium]